MENETLLSKQKKDQAEDPEDAERYTDDRMNLVDFSHACAESLMEEIIRQHHFPVAISDGDIVRVHVPSEVIGGFLFPHRHSRSHPDGKTNADAGSDSGGETHV